jgi:hypothetical protein
MSLLDTASLIVTPNGYKEGKLYSVIPSDGSGDLSVTRATTATRVNSAGLVELVPYNLLEYSEQFNNGAAWALNNATITANNTTAPDGTMTADKVVVSSNTDNVIQSSLPFSGVGTSNTISLYIKGSGSNIGKEVGLYIDRQGSGTYEASTIVGVLTAEWQRIEVTHTWVNSQTAVRYKISQGITTTPATEFFIWGAQLVEGSTAKDYQKTETRLNIPRLDYSNGTCPSLLVEPQRTNAVTYSEFFSTANGYNYQNASQSGSSIVSPSGLLAYGINSEISANNFHRYYKTLGGRTGVNTTTIFAKKGTSRFLGLGVNQNGSTGNNNVVVFDLLNGVIASNTYGVTASIENFGNDWYRLVHTFDYGTGGTYADICVHNTGTSTYTINAFQTFDSPSSPTTIYVWGLQMELGSYATSYIPTTSASVTRNADVISKTGISSLIGQTEGTMFFDVYAQLNNADEQDLSISDGTGNNRAIIRLTSSGTIRGIGVFGGNLEFNIGGSAYTTGTRYKIALAYKNNDVALYVNGTSQGTSSSTTISGTLSRLGFDVFTNGAQIICSPTNATALWKTRLTNTQLAQLTTI